MRKIFLICFLLVSALCFGQYPITQNLGSGSTLVQVPSPGALRASIINRVFTDTTAANLTHIKLYPFSQIGTSNDGFMWIRNSTATMWIRLFNTFSNGLNESGGAVKLGGSLTEETEISGFPGYQNFSFSDLGSFFTQTRNNGIILFEADKGITQNNISRFYFNADTMCFHPGYGNLTIDSLNNVSSQNQLIGWTSTSGADRGKVGYITPGSGISISEGVISVTNGVDTTSLSNRINQKQNLSFNYSTITEQGSYTAFAFSYTYQDTLHIVASQGVDHLDKMDLVEFVTGDGGVTYDKRTILTHADTSFRDAGGGVDSAGRVWLFATKYTYTSPGEYSNDPNVNAYEYNENTATYTPVQYNLSRNGNAFVASYGKVVSIGDTTLMTAYGGNTNKVWIYASVNGGAWSVKSNIYSGADDNNETCIERISTNTLVAISRTSGLSPKFFISHDCGNSWVNTGNVYGGVANNVSPWLHKTDDTTLVYVYGDRNVGAMFLRGAEFNTRYLDTAIASTASTNSFYRNLNLAESVLNNRTNTPNFGSHFGYPSITYANGEYVLIYNDLYSLQPSPYGGSDPVTVSLITMPLRPRVLLKAYNSAQQTFVPNVETRVTFNNTYTDTRGILQSNNNIIIPKDGLYEIHFSTALTTFPNGRRQLKIYKVDGTDTTTTTNRKVVIQKDFPTISGYFGYDHNIESSCKYYFNKGDIIKVTLHMIGSSADVTNAFTQIPGNSNEGIYSNYIEVRELKQE